MITDAEIQSFEDRVKNLHERISDLNSTYHMIRETNECRKNDIQKFKKQIKALKEKMQEQATKAEEMGRPLQYKAKELQEAVENAGVGLIDIQDEDIQTAAAAGVATYLMHISDDVQAELLNNILAQDEEYLPLDEFRDTVKKLTQTLGNHFTKYAESTQAAYNEIQGKYENAIRSMNRQPDIPQEEMDQFRNNVIERFERLKNIQDSLDYNLSRQIINKFNQVSNYITEQFNLIMSAQISLNDFNE